MKKDTQTITITYPEFMGDKVREKINVLLATIAALGSQGASRTVEMDWDGDGHERITIDGLDDVEASNLDKDIVKIRAGSVMKSRLDSNKFRLLSRVIFRVGREYGETRLDSKSGIKEVASRYRELGPAGVNNTTSEHMAKVLLEVIHNPSLLDTSKYQGFFSTKNRVTRQIFEEITKIKLPIDDKNIKLTIKKRLGSFRLKASVIAIIYDNGGKSLDRYTVIIGKDVFSMCENPLSSQGVNQFIGNIGTDIKPGPNLGKKVLMSSLPLAVQKAIKKRIQESRNDEDMDNYRQGSNLIFRQEVKSLVKRLISMAKEYKWEIDETKLLDAYRRGYFILRKYVGEKLSKTELLNRAKNDWDERRLTEIMTRYKVDNVDDLYEEMYKDYQKKLEDAYEEARLFRAEIEKAGLGLSVKINEIDSRLGLSGLSLSFDMNSNKVVTFASKE